MDNILVINAGSTSVKYKVFNLEEKQLVEGKIEAITDYQEAFKQILRRIINLGEIKIVGHRVVYGGELFKEPILIDDNILAELEKYNRLAPLHNPYNLAGIKAAQSYLPETAQVAVFDTSFYSKLPREARLYALPKKIIAEHKIYRYGFHGTSHEFAAQEAAKALGKKNEEVNLISCHLGGGSSITAVKRGRAIETSMGFTPNEGLVMMTRSGDLDSGAVIELIKSLPGEINNEKIDFIYQLLNSQSGIKGLTEGVDNFQDLIKRFSLGQADSLEAFNLYIHRLIKYIGAYWFLLEGKVDALVFTGAVGAGNPLTRNSIIKRLKFLGDLRVLTVKTNEELMIARQIKKFITRNID